MIEKCNIGFKDIIEGSVDIKYEIEKIRNMDILSDDCVTATKVFHKKENVIIPSINHITVVPWKVIMWRVCCSI